MTNLLARFFIPCFFIVMAGLRVVRDAVSESYYNAQLNDEEFLLLTDLNRSRNPEFPYNKDEVFHLESMNESECKAEFRFEKEDIVPLLDVLALPDKFVCNQGSKCSALEGLCILLKRLTYPCRYSDMMHRFQRPVPELSMIVNTVLDYVYIRHSHRLTQWNMALLNPAALEQYAEVITEKGSALTNCLGFIDGTVRPICRPEKNQKVVYNGHKRIHSLKFQSLVLPNGIIGNLYGPVGKT